MNLGDKIIILREEQDLSRGQVANDLKIPYNTFSKYETNERQPDYDTLKSICIYFGVSTDFLLGFEAVKSTEDSILENATRNNNISKDKLLLAAHITKDLTEDEQNQLIQFAKFLKTQRKSNT